MLNKKLLGSVSSAPGEYVEDVFSTYLYTGTNANQTITNNIDLAGEGGLVWLKNRSGGYNFNNFLFDTVRGANNTINTNNNLSAYSALNTLTSFNSNGFSLGNDSGDYGTNKNTVPNVSWTFRKQPKFFDIVTWSGNGVNYRVLNHSLGSQPGMIIVKRITGGTENWPVWHRSISAGGAGNVFLNLTLGTSGSKIKDADASTFTLDASDTSHNASGSTYIAYLFAHNAGGFGTSGTDNAISCGSVTADAGGAATVNLGFEPQFVMYKSATSAENWYMSDVMRGMYAPTTMGNVLYPSLSNAEAATTRCPFINATGMSWDGNYNYLAPNQTYIYMAIRRPMKVPTDATTVFSPVKATATTPGFNAGFPVDMGILKNYPSGGFNELCSRLQGANYLTPTDTSAEGADSGAKFDYQNGWYSSLPANTYIGWNFARRPGFFDQVCYTGNNTERTINHNLGVAPELMIVKNRTNSGFNWEVWSAYTNVTAPYGHDTLKLNLTNAAGATGYFPTDPTSSVFTVSSNNQVNQSSANFVSYLFATCAGVSKVGSYSGTGANTTNQIDCGFTAGARFVMIKRTNATGNWYVFDTTRGITSGNDPFLALNTTNAENSSYNCITPYSAGFNINDASNVGLNETGGSYIYLAIA